MKLRMGTRGSQLARTQSGTVARALEALGHQVEVVIIKTQGDQDRERAFAAVGAPGLFVREIETALLEERVDFAVHSFKDLPSQSPEGLAVVAIPQRVDPVDILVARPGTFAGDALIPLPAGAVVGTASARRQALLATHAPGVTPKLLRGNVPTRANRLREGEFDAVLLAAAGVQRLDEGSDGPPLLDGLDVLRLDPARFVPAPAQGALALQVRAADAGAVEAVGALDHAPTRRAVAAERELLRRMQGGCELPFGAWCREEDGELVLSACLGEVGAATPVATCEGRGEDPLELAAEVWGRLRG